MKVFLSWSGETSHKIALFLRDWLPTVLPQLKPWVSSEDIQKGGRWGLDLSKELEDTTWGIICLDPSNVDSPWLNFEAGALSKSIQSARVAPLLFGLKPSDLSGPLTQFQITNIEKADMLKLLKSLNSTFDDQIPIERLDKTFKLTWPAVRNFIVELPATKTRNVKSAITDKGTDSTDPKELRLREVQMLRTIASMFENSGIEFADISELKELLKISKIEVRSILRKLQQYGFINVWFDSNQCQLIEKGEDYVVRNKLL